MAIYLSLALIFTCTWLQASETYILSYRAQIKDAVVISESYHFSQAMTEVDSTKAQSLKFYSPNRSDIHTIVYDHKDEILEFLMRHGVHTRSHEKITDLKSSSLINLTLPPTYITVDFNDDYAIITRLILK